MSEPMDIVKWAIRCLVEDPNTPELRSVEDIERRTFAPGSRGAAFVGFAVIALRDAGELRFCPDTGWGRPCKYADKGCTAPEWRGQPEHNRGCCVECGAEA